MGAATKVAGDVRSMARYAAALAFESQLIHLWVLLGEFAVRPLVGSFVFLAAVGQGMLGASLIFGPGRWAVRFGLLLNATIVLAWAATRVAGFPALLGFVRLPAEPLGLVTTFLEVALVISLLKVGRELKTKGTRRRVR
jgi:hypothetical protein